MNKIRCPKCNDGNTYVCDSRAYRNNRILRRRKCIGCEFRFSTVEYVYYGPDKIEEKKCAYLGCAKPAHSKGNCAKYCETHHKGWQQLKDRVFYAWKSGKPLRGINFLPWSRKSLPSYMVEASR